MRQLDTCDFCGEQPEGVYEVVPEAIAGGPQRLALCASCRDTLQGVVDPLLDAAERRAGAASSRSTSDNSDQQSEPAPASPSNRPEQPDIAMPSGAESGDDAATGDAATQDAATGDAATQDAATADAVAEESAAADSTTEESAAAEPQSTESPAKKPDGYAQVLRLLQNRNEAMARADLHALATNAYDLGDRTFERAVDAAIENGDVEETADGLRTL